MNEEQKISKTKKKRKIIKQNNHEELKQVNISERIDITEQSEQSEQSEILEQIKSIDIQKIKTEEITFENLNELNTEQPNAFKSIISQIPSDYSEIIVFDQTANLAPDNPNQLYAISICHPHVLPVTQETFVSETEKYLSFLLQNTQNSKLILPENTSVETFVANIVDNAKQMEPIHSTPSVQIQPAIEPNESILASEVVVNEDVSELEVKPQNVLNAKINCAALHAPIVSEDFSSEKEGALNQSRMHSGHAKLNLLPVEAIEIANYEQNEKEGDFIPAESMVNNAILNILSRESIEVTQTFSEIMPEKYYPEIMVPTEVALSNVVEHKSCVRTEINVSEKEDRYTSIINPIGQKASAELIKSDAITIDETKTNENTQLLENLVQPGLENASGSYSTYEGLQKQMDDYLESSGVLSINLIFDTKHAKSEMTEHISNIMEIVQVNESENAFLPSDKPKRTTAELSFTLNEPYNQLQPALHESEAEFIKDATRNFLIAVPELVPNQEVQTGNVETLDSVNDLKHTKIPILTEATVNFEHRQHSEGLDIVAHEKEKSFDRISLPAQIKPNVISDELKALQVENPNIIDKEGTFEFPILSTKQSVIVPTHSLPLSVQEEVTIALSVDKLEEKKSEQVQAHSNTDLLNETLVSLVDVNESVSDSIIINSSKLGTAKEIIDTKTAIEVFAPDVQDLDDILEDYVDLDRQKTIQKSLKINDSHMPLIVELNEVIDTFDELHTKPPGKLIADIAVIDQNEIVVSVSTCLENVSELSIADGVPPGANAKVTMNEDHSLNIMVTKTIENELPLDVYNPGIQKNASVTISDALCHLYTEESNALIEPLSLKPKLPNKTTAKITHSNLQEISIEEPFVLEEIKPFKVIVHDERISKPDVEDHHHIIVIEQQFQDNVNKLNEHQTVNFRIDNIDISHALTTAEIFETHSEYSNGTMVNDSPLEFVPHITNDEQRSMQSLEIMTFEQAPELLNKNDLLESKATIGYTELTSIISSDQSTWENESNLKESQNANSIANTSATHLLKTAQVEETQLFFSNGQINENKLIDQFSAIKQLHTFDEIFETDTVAFESLNSDVFTLKTNEGVATTVIEESQHLYTSMSKTEEISETLAQLEMKSEQKIRSIPTDLLKSIVVQEVSTNDILNDLPFNTSDKQLAKFTAEVLNQTDGSEVVSCIDTVIEHYRPHHLIERTTESIETISAQIFELEETLNISKTKPVSAQLQIIDQHNVLGKSEANIYESISEMPNSVIIEKGNMVVMPNTEVQVQQTNDSESVGTTDDYKQPAKCTANINIDGKQTAVGYAIELVENSTEIKIQEDASAFANPAMCSQNEAVLIEDTQAIKDELLQMSPEINTNKLANISLYEGNEKSLQITDITGIDSLEKIPPDQRTHNTAILSLEKTHVLPEQIEIYSSEQTAQMDTKNIKHHFATSMDQTFSTAKYISETFLIESAKTFANKPRSKNLQKTANNSIEGEHTTCKTTTEMQSTIYKNLFNTIDSNKDISKVPTVKGKYIINSVQVITNMKLTRV